MLGGHVGENARHERTQQFGQRMHESGFFCQAHDTEPERHDAGEGQGERHDRRFAGLERCGGHFLEFSRGPAEHDGAEDEGQPDVIQHGKGLGGMRGSGKGGGGFEQ